MEREYMDKSIIESWDAEKNGKFATKAPIEISKIIGHKIYENEQHTTDFAYTEWAMRMLMEYLKE